jgi:hypothetical protein
VPRIAREARGRSRAQEVVSPLSPLGLEGDDLARREAKRVAGSVGALRWSESSGRRSRSILPHSGAFVEAARRAESADVLTDRRLRIEHPRRGRRRTRRKCREPAGISGFLHFRRPRGERQKTAGLGRRRSENRDRHGWSAFHVELHKASRTDRRKPRARWKITRRLLREWRRDFAETGW